jgi:hypothetical protein
LGVDSLCLHLDNKIRGLLPLSQFLLVEHSPGWFLNLFVYVFKKKY